MSDIYAGPDIHLSGCLPAWMGDQECARDFDLELRLFTLGPLYRVVAKNMRDGEAVGYSSGFIVPPLGLVHLDTMQVDERWTSTHRSLALGSRCLWMGWLCDSDTVGVSVH